MDDTEFEELPEIEPTWLRLQRATALRKRLLAAGYMPLPCNGKAPPIAGWQDIVATSALIDNWERRYSDATNTGVLCDISPAIDIDVMHPEAAEAIEALAREHFEEHGYVLVRFGKAPKRAILLRTNEPFNKIARMFTAPDGSTQNIEILATGQQIVVAGVHPETKRDYSWHGGEPGEIKREDLPYVREADMRGFVDAAAALLVGEFGFTAKDSNKRKANGGERPHSNGAAGAAGIREKTYAQVALDRNAEELAAAAAGSRNELLNKLAFRLGRMIARGWISRADVEAALIGAMHANGAVTDDGLAATEATLRSGIDAGMAEPHPDLADQTEENEWTEASSSTKSESPASLGECDAGDDIEKPPPRHWLLGNQFCRKFLSGLFAPGATGKSALRLAQYLSLATGRALTGEHVFKRCRVLVVSFEDGHDEMRRRILAARLHYNVSFDELKGWLFYATPKGMKLAEMKGGSRQIGLLEKHLRAAIERRKPALVGLDPFVKLHGLEENDNSAMDYVADLLVSLAIEYDIAVDAPHHTKKGQLTPGDADSGRGASSVRDAGRLMYTLSTMDETEAKTFGIDPEQRHAYVRLDKGKVNLVPPARIATWFKLIGVPLDNGTADYPAGDEVQTVEPWSPPKMWEGLSAAALNAALTEIDKGLENGQRYSDGPSARERAAWRVVQRHCPDRTEAQCREIIRTWASNGVLYNDDYDDPIDRKTRKGLRLDPAKRPS